MRFEPCKEIVITEIKTFDKFCQNSASLKNCTLQGIDFKGKSINWDKIVIDNTVFLGCGLELEEEIQLRRKGAYLYRAPESLPYRPFRRTLYDWKELMEGYPERTTDLSIYEHFSNRKFNPSINEALWQRIHDHSIDDALRKLLLFDEQGMTQKKCIGFMGGHSKSRESKAFEQTAKTARLLGKEGYFIVSGGGPGIMEAANLGAYFANYSESDLLQALQVLKGASSYTDAGYHDLALKVLEMFPNGQENLAIPTWFYGHEPSNLFASHIAKYFSNSIREDTLIAISLYGIVCAEGSAGTTQEIFMDATQNHYGTFNYYSPMVFLGRQRYEIDTLIFPLLKQLSWGREYHDLLFLTDHPEEVVKFLKSHPPVKVKEATAVS
jgi:predicted Rossmann-fold nucleotide-binding protein